MPDPPTCASCNYDLTGLGATAECPECGGAQRTKPIALLLNRTWPSWLALLLAFGPPALRIAFASAAAPLSVLSNSVAMFLSLLLFLIFAPLHAVVASRMAASSNSEILRRSASVLCVAIFVGDVVAGLSLITSLY